ncbi:hypothetical protein M434DRAFT_28102 [Hypoxylon sp. CO27-5]|nr:hypothetical protein M434DRAFT_28102 [Hypoxylon sp. CO27-5]
MRSSTVLSTGLAILATAIGAPILLPSNSTSNVNVTIVGDEDILGEFALNSPEITNLASTQGKYQPSDAVPFAELPQCYQDCIETNCCNGWPSLGDVRRLTVHEWCHSKWIPVHAWLYEHLQFCIKHACRECRPQCRDESIRWQDEVCAND